MAKNLASWKKELYRCSRCGSCINVCPIYKELEKESAVARGRVRLIKGIVDGELDLTDGFEEKVSLCLMCKACVTNCPSGVQVDKLVEAARKEIAEKKGLHPVKKFVFRGILKNRTILNNGARLGSKFQNLFFRPDLNNKGMYPRISVGLDKKRLIGNLADTPFRSQYSEVVKVNQPKMRVAFFTGCMINFMYPDTGKSVLNILKAHDVEVVIPSLQNCCGTPVRINGDDETAKEMAKANIDCFLAEDYDAIVVACGTCGLSLKEEYAELLEDEHEYFEKAKRLGAKVKDITEILTSLGGYQEKMGNLNAKVTYHDPCHLVRGMKVKTEPRELISAIPGVEFKEMKKPDTCCGGGGSFSLYHYDVSKQVNDRKVKDIKETGADIIVTGCSLCRMHIIDGLNRNNVYGRMIHTADLINMAYESGK